MLHAAVGTPVAASWTATQCNVTRGSTCMHTWNSFRRVQWHREADTTRARHMLHMYTSQKKQRYTLTCLCAAGNSAVSKLWHVAVLTWLLDWGVTLLTVRLFRTDSSGLRPTKVKVSFVVFLPLLDSTWNWATPTPFHTVPNVTFSTDNIGTQFDPLTQFWFQCMYKTRKHKT